MWQTIESTCRNLVPLYEKDKKEIIPLTNVPQKVRYLGISITEEVKDLYKENYITLLKKKKI